MTPAPPEAAPSPWLVSARFDFAAFVVPAALSIVVGALSSHLGDASGATPPWAWLLLVVFVDVAHVHGTTLRTYLDPYELRRRPVLYALAPALGLTAGIAAYATSAALFWRLLAYAAVFHFVRQQVGWLRLYRARAGDRSRADRHLDEAALYIAMIYPLVAWHARVGPQPDPIAWFMPGDFIAGVPAIVATVARWLWATLLVAFTARQIQRALRGDGVQPGKVLLVATTAATWWCGIVLLGTDFAFTVTNVIAHGVPYMAISYRVAAPRDAAAPPSPATPLFARAHRYVAVLAALAYIEEWLWDRAVWQEHAAFFPGPLLDVNRALPVIVPLLALPQLVHYVLDGFVWRLDGSNPGLAHALGLASRPAVEIKTPAHP